MFALCDLLCHVKEDPYASVEFVLREFFSIYYGGEIINLPEQLVNSLSLELRQYYRINFALFFKDLIILYIFQSLCKKRSRFYLIDTLGV